MKTSLIQYLLAEKGTTQDRIADAIGVAKSTVSDVIRHRTKSEKIERAIAVVLELPVQDVFPSRYDARGALLPRTRRVLNRHYNPAAALAALQSELSRASNKSAAQAA